VQEQLVSAGHIDAAGGPDITRMREQQLGRSTPLVTEWRGPYKSVSTASSSRERCTRPDSRVVPVRRGEHKRQRVEVPRPRVQGAVAVGDRIAVPVDLDVGDAVVVDQAATIDRS